MSARFRKVASFEELLTPTVAGEDSLSSSAPSGGERWVTQSQPHSTPALRGADDSIIRRGGVQLKPAIEQLIGERKIRGLVHFTPMQNLPSILDRGLMPRDKLEQLRVRGQAQVDYSDRHRFDGKESSCLSIAFPNGDMFFRKRKERPEWKWVVLVFHPEEILNHQSTTFTASNASRGGLERVSGAEGLRRVFGDSPVHWRCPPDRQAEVRSPVVLGVDLIKVICCHTEDDVKEVRGFIANARFAPGTTGAWQGRIELATTYFDNPRPPKYRDFPYS